MFTSRKVNVDEWHTEWYTFWSRIFRAEIISNTEIFLAGFNLSYILSNFYSVTLWSNQRNPSSAIQHVCQRFVFNFSSENSGYH